MGGGEASAELSVTGGEPLPDNRAEIRFAVENTSLAGARISYAELYRDNAKIQDVDARSLNGLPSGGSAMLSVKSDGVPFAAGEYELKIFTDSEMFSAEQTLVSVPENERFHLSAVSAEKTSDGVKLTLQNNMWDKSDITNADVSGIYVLNDNQWQPSALVRTEYLKFDSTYEISGITDFSLKNGEKIDFEFVPVSAVKAFDEISELFADLVKVRSGSRCAVVTNVDNSEEWVYFTMP